MGLCLLFYYLPFLKKKKNQVIPSIPGPPRPVTLQPYILSVRGTFVLYMHRFVSGNGTVTNLTRASKWKKHLLRPREDAASPMEYVIMKKEDLKVLFDNVACNECHE